MSKLIKNIIIVLLLAVIAIVLRNAYLLQQKEPFGSVVTSLAKSLTGTPSYYEDDVYVRGYATTSIIARNVTSTSVVRLIQNVGDQPATIWLFADATTTQPSYAGGVMRLGVLNTTSADTAILDLSWFRGSIWAITEDSHTYLKVLTFP